MTWKGFAALCFLLAIIWAAVALNRWMRHREQDTAAWNDELDQADPVLEVHHETLSDLLEEDVAAGGVGAAETVVAESPPVVLSPPDRRPSPGRARLLQPPRPPARQLTPRQRKRGVKKGRIPRTLPSPADDSLTRGPDAAAGEYHERVAEARDWLAADAGRVRYEEYRAFWSDLDREAREAYAVTAAGFSVLERVDWLRLAA